MTTKKQPTIKAATGFRIMKPEVVFTTSQAIYNALNGNATIAAPPSPFDLPTLLAANQALIDGKYRSSMVDLNDDSMPDAIVLFDQDRCGTGGCNMEIYRGTKTGFEFLSGSTITFPPILVTSEKRYGWKTLIVFSGGTGTVLIRFNGSRYPLNPSLQPEATQLQVKEASTVLDRKN